VLTNNKAVSPSGKGGGLNAVNSSGGASVTISLSTFDECSGVNGGAVCVKGVLFFSFIFIPFFIFFYQKIEIINRSKHLNYFRLFI
jgi:hypothetical protein